MTFFPGKFYDLTTDFFLSSVHSLNERKAKSLIEQQKCKFHDKCDRLLVLKVDINLQNNFVDFEFNFST